MKYKTKTNCQHLSTHLLIRNYIIKYRIIPKPYTDTIYLLIKEEKNSHGMGSIEFAENISPSCCLKKDLKY